ncbi:RraA family protein [Variovorax sp. J31P207]|uniref:RraA family protein n=1 Tax=Variovorax sp. J31P207 TaxID=3053510 RepID=UPI0025750EE9|nr:RraA family protein [Variovorax sp. J31P207]MDM0072128.1 RraA family protein [Variovorax sp. J31P207]
MSQELPAIRRDIERVSPELIAKAATFAASILADVAGRRGTMNGRIQGVDRRMKIAGPAFTVEVRPGDNLMMHAALAQAQPGDVIVVDGKADLTCALTGFLMVSQAKAAGLGGFVIDAAVRDTEEISESGFPVFAAGANPNGPTKGLGGRVNWPVCVGGTSVNPGDLIIGDADGVVVIPKETAALTIAAAQAKLDFEQGFLASLASGEVKNGWVSESLRSVGMLADGEAL